MRIKTVQKEHKIERKDTTNDETKRDKVNMYIENKSDKTSSLHSSCDILSQRDTVCNIFSFLDIYSLLACEKVSHSFLEFARDPSSVVLFDYFYGLNNRQKIPTDILRFRNCKRLKLNINNISSSESILPLSQFSYFNKLTCLSLYIYPTNTIQQKIIHKIKHKLMEMLPAKISIVSICLYGDFDDKQTIEFVSKCESLIH